MRYYNILKEDGNLQEEIKSAILDLIIPLKNQGVDSITLKQLMDQVTSSEEIMGMDISPSYISQVANKIPGCTCSTGADGEKVVDISGLNPNAGTKEGSQDEVEKSATKQAEKDLDQ